jgi:hypothetical protein
MIDNLFLIGLLSGFQGQAAEPKMVARINQETGPVNVLFRATSLASTGRTADDRTIRQISMRTKLMSNGARAVWSFLRDRSAK